jgi:hypothetical protein
MDAFRPEQIKNFDPCELIGDCYLYSESSIDDECGPDDGPAIEGSLPFEVLGARYLESIRMGSQRRRMTVMLV